MFTQEDIDAVMEEEMKQKAIDEVFLQEIAEREEMKIYVDDDLLYDSLIQEAYEEYCVPIRRYRGRGLGSEY